ncbi:hypothetical protein C3489_37595 [Streptomyces sp. Ru71]|nr:hypothetical protein C3489_37595 [Streptomyces sp. Ru71]
MGGSGPGWGVSVLGPAHCPRHGCRWRCRPLRADTPHPVPFPPWATAGRHRLGCAPPRGGGNRPRVAAGGAAPGGCHTCVAAGSRAAGAARVGAGGPPCSKSLGEAPRQRR